MYTSTRNADTPIATKLGISLTYLRRPRAERPDLYDAYVHGLLHGKSRRTTTGETAMIHPADDRSRSYCGCSAARKATAA